MFKNGMSVGELIAELQKLDSSKMIWQRLDSYHGGVKSIGTLENGDYCFDEFAKNEDTEKYVIEFIRKLKEQYPDILVEYNFQGGMFNITHNYKKEYQDKEFLIYIENLMEDSFFKNDISNIGFWYDFDKYMPLKTE